MKKILLQDNKYFIFNNNSDFYQNGLSLEELLKNIVSNPKFFEEHLVSNEFLLEIIDDLLVLDQYYLLHNITPVYTFELETIKILLSKGHLELKELEYLSLNTYFNFDKDFITEYQDYLNWHKIILRKANVNGLVSFNVLEKKKINELNLWDLASSFQLEKKFIKKNRQKLNWEIIGMTNNFTKEELEEYPELVNYKIEDVDSIIKPITTSSLNEDGFLAFDNTTESKNEVCFNGIVHEITNPETKISNEITQDVPNSMKFIIPVGKSDPNKAKEELEKLFSEYKEDIKFDDDKGEIILDGKLNIPKDIWFIQGEGSPNLELLTDTPTAPLTDTFVPVKKEEKVSIISKLINKIKSLFYGK